MKSKPLGCLSYFKQKLRVLRAIDKQNQELFTSSLAKKKGSRRFTKTQMYLLTETVFFAAFRAYEQFLRNVFLLYCCGVPSSKRKLVQSHLRPQSIQHAEELVQSSMPFLDWSSPDILLERSETYLKDGYPIKATITMYLEQLRELKKVRNHIAHMSKESLEDFKKVVKTHYATLPLRTPIPGEFLLLPSRRISGYYYLLEYMKIIEDVATSMT
ncbi:MAG: hypothetical protein ABSE89_01240 [Sedimentisphaerales bacterium]